MADDLERLFGALASTLPALPDADADEVVLSASNVERCDDVLSTDRIVVIDGLYSMVSSVGDRIHLEFATRATCRMLGLLVLSVLFHAEPATVELRLTNPRSEVRRLRVRYRTGVRRGMCSPPRTGPCRRSCRTCPATSNAIPTRRHTTTSS